MPLIIGLLSFLAVMLGFRATRRAQLDADVRKTLQAVRSSRAIAYAQMARITSTTGLQLKFIAGDSKMIWLIVHRSLFPAVENLDRLGPLTASEVQAVTSFYYLYQEQISFLTGSALEAFPDDMRTVMAAKFCNNVDVIGFDYTTQGRKDALNNRLKKILREAEKAVAAIAAAATLDAGSHALQDLISVDIAHAEARKRRALSALDAQPETV